MAAGARWLRCRKAEQVMCPKPTTGYWQDYNTLWRGRLVIGHDRPAGPMSRMGQTEKNAVRAYVFRFALEPGHSS